MTTQIAQTRLEDIFLQLKNDIFATFNCHRIGRIVSFDPSKQTADVELVDKATVEVFEGNKVITKIRDYPLLAECPVLINKGSKGGFTRPIEKGEYCIVHFNDRDIDNWFENGNIQIPNTKRLHNITDCIITVGLFSGSAPISDYNNEATEINYEDSKIKLDGNVTINSSQLSQMILDINALLQSSLGATLTLNTNALFQSSSGATLDLGSTVGISNGSQDLGSLIGQLITVLKNFTSVDNPAGPTITVVPNNTTQANLDQLLTDFQQLLT